MVLAVSALALVGMAWQAVSATRRAAEQDLTRALERAVERVRVLTDAAERTAASLERVASVPGVSPETLHTALERALAAFEQRPELSYLGIALQAHGEYGNLERTADGRILLWLHPGRQAQAMPVRNFLLTDLGFAPNAEQPANGYDARERPFYQGALADPTQGRWLPAYPWIVHGDDGSHAPLWGYSYVKALRDADGGLVGVLDVDFDLPALNRFLATAAEQYAVQLRLVELGPQPRLVGDASVQGAPLALPQDLATLVAAGDGASAMRWLRGAGQWSAARRLDLPGGLSWAVVATRETDLIGPALRSQLYQVLGLGLVLAAGLALISVRLARRLGRPLRALERSVAQAGQAAAPQQFAVAPMAGGFRETQRLGQALDRMAGAVRQREQQLAAQNVELLQAKEQQLASLALRAAIFESADTALVSLDAQRTVLEWNAGAEHLFGVRRAQILGRPVSDAICGPDGPADWNAMLATVGAGTFALAGAHGAFDAELRVVGLAVPDRPGCTLVVHDVSARRAMERHLQHLATHDALTDLPNRNLLQQRFSEAVARAQRSGRPLALLLLDLDRFKTVNDTYGHPFGDEVLKQVGARLQALLRSNDTLARQGGDQFLVLLTDLQVDAEAGATARQLIDSVREPVVLQDREIHLSGSVGLSLFPQHGGTAEALIRNADQAMYRAKALGRATCVVFTQAMDQETQQRAMLETQLRGAAQAGQLQLFYQPKVSLASGDIVGCEALLRWQHPELGWVPPSQFIPVAEDCGLIVPLSDWVLRTACLQARAWADAGLPCPTVAVNISARQLLQQDLAAWTQAMLRETGLAPQLLELELTESLIAQDVERMIATFAQLKEAGVRLSIDDFGTGYSSLSYLKHFRVDTLKIDQSFVRNMLEQPDDETIVRAVIALAHNLGFKVIAEGVETAAHAQRLRAHGCDEIQGYLFSRPLEAAAFTALLRSGRRLSDDAELVQPASVA